MILNRQPSQPLPGAQSSSAEALDLVFIEGFTGRTVIGIHGSELHEPQPIVIDLCAGVARLRACRTDHIDDTIDYAALRARLLRLLAEHRVQLLEALAEAVADIVLGEFGASWVQVKAVKPRKFDDVTAVGVQIERHAPLAADGSPLRSAAMLHLIGSGMVPR